MKKLKNMKNDVNKLHDYLQECDIEKEHLIDSIMDISRDSICVQTDNV